VEHKRLEFGICVMPTTILIYHCFHKPWVLLFWPLICDCKSYVNLKGWIGYSLFKEFQGILIVYAIFFYLFLSAISVIECVVHVKLKDNSYRRSNAPHLIKLHDDYKAINNEWRMQLQAPHMFSTDGVRCKLDADTLSVSSLNTRLSVHWSETIW